MQTCVKYTSTKQVFSSWLSLWRTGGQGHHGPVDGPLQIIQQKGDYLKLTNHICEEYELVPQYSMKLTHASYLIPSRNPSKTHCKTGSPDHQPVHKKVEARLEQQTLVAGIWTVFSLLPVLPHKRDIHARGSLSHHQCLMQFTWFKGYAIKNGFSS